MTAISWEAPQLRARGSHHKRSRLGRLKQRLIDWNEREAQDREDRRAAERYLKGIIRRADLPGNAVKSARHLMWFVPFLAVVCTFYPALPAWPIPIGVMA